jgi:hypothetical protein
MECTGPTEDAGWRRFAAGRRVLGVAEESTYASSPLRRRASTTAPTAATNSR